MAWRLIPKLHTRRRTLMRGTVLNTRLYPQIVEGIPAWIEAKQRPIFARGLWPFIAPIDPVGRMDTDSLKAFQAAVR